MPDLIIPTPFKRRLARKPPAMQAAIMECVYRLGEDPRHPGLRTHRVQGTRGVYEARVDRNNRVTFEYGINCIILRAHCNHAILRVP